MTETATPARIELLPPTYGFGCALLMIAIHVFFPLVRWAEPPLTYAGFGFIAVAGAIVGWAAWTFRRSETPIHPFETPRCLVTAGPYRYSRNPMYLSLVLMLVGLFVLLGSVTPIVVVLMFQSILTMRFIEPEERTLEALYGDAFRRYAAKVRRWI